MINTVIFEDEITLFWDKQWDMPDDILYKITCNGKTVVNTTKTHYTFVGLSADTEYFFSVERLDKKCKTVEILYKNFLRTKKARKRIDVTKHPYNAVGDGETLNTASIQLALLDCKQNETVYFPNGVYLTGALDIHSNTDIYLEKGAILLASTNPNDYLLKRRNDITMTEMETYRSMFNVGTTDDGSISGNVSIRGNGKIKGDSVSLITISNCENVMLANIELECVVACNISIFSSKNVVLYGCVIRAEEQGKTMYNENSCHFESSENCAVFNTVFSTHNNAVSIKSKKMDGRSKNICVFNCHGNNGILIGRENLGEISDIYIWDCDFSESTSGCQIQTAKNCGGYVKNVKIRNCALVDFKVLSGDTCDKCEKNAGALTKLEELYCENTYLTGLSKNLKTKEEIYVAPIMLCGVEEEYYIERVKMKNIHIAKRKDEILPKIQIKNVRELNLEMVDFID